MFSRYISASLLSFFFFASVAHAAPNSAVIAARIAEQKETRKSINTLFKEFLTLENDQKILAKHWRDSTLLKEQIEEQAERCRAEMNAFESERIKHEESVAVHTVRCGQYRVQNDSCDAEARAGNVRAEELRQWASRLNVTKDVINRAMDARAEDDKNILVRREANDTRMKEIRARMNFLAGRLKVIEAEVSACIVKIQEDHTRNDDITREVVRNECGKVFNDE